MGYEIQINVKLIITRKLWIFWHSYLSYLKLRFRILQGGYLYQNYAIMRDTMFPFHLRIFFILASTACLHVQRDHQFLIVDWLFKKYRKLLNEMCMIRWVDKETSTVQTDSFVLPREIWNIILNKVYVS